MTELLVVIAIMAVLISLLLPSLTKAQSKAQGIQCLNNMRQLSLAWRLYSEDSCDQIPYASSTGVASDASTWVTGLIDFDRANRSNWDVEKDLKKSPLWTYCGNAAAVWKCAADKSAVVPSSGPFKGQRVPRVRSMAMMVWLGGFAGKFDDPISPGLVSPPWRLYRTLNDFLDPGPSRTLLFWDQREDSINLGNFYVDMAGFPDKPQSARITYDFPACYHNRAGGLSFVDGHAEIKRWLDSRTAPPLRKGSNALAQQAVASPNNPDVLWLQERATRQAE